MISFDELCLAFSEGVQDKQTFERRHLNTTVAEQQSPYPIENV